jgi:hypothetical protein
MCLKIFSFKSQVFKNPVSALFKQLMITVFGFLDSFLRPIVEKKLKNVDERRVSQDMHALRRSVEMMKAVETNVKEEIEILESKAGNEVVDDIIDNIVNDAFGGDDNDDKLEDKPNEKHDVKDKPHDDSAEFDKQHEDEGEHVDDENVPNDEHNDGDKDEEGNENKSVHDEAEADAKDNDDHDELEHNPHVPEEYKEDHTISVNIVRDSIKHAKHAEIETEEKKYIEEPLIPTNLKKGQSIDLSEFTSIDIYITSLSVFKNLLLIAEGKKKDWIASSIYSKCLGLELLSGVISQTGWLFKYLPEFVEIIKTDLFKIIQKYFESAPDYVTGLKLCRLSVQIMENMNICYDLLPFVFKFVETPTLTWQKQVGMESICNLVANNNTMFDLYRLKFENPPVNYYDDVINALTKVSYAVITMKDKKGTTELAVIKNNSKVQKVIEMSTIYTETDTNVPQFTQLHACKLLNESYTYLKDSFIVILENNNIKLGKVNSEFSDDQQFCKNMLDYNYESIKNAMTALLINSNDDSTTQSYLVLFQSFINIFGSISLPIARDSYLNDLCKLAIPNNLENSLELKEKNMLIAKTLFNIAHCVNIIDENSWLLLVETMQKIYLMLINSNNHMLKPNEEFEIDVIIKNLEVTIRKYNPDFGLNEEKHVLRQSLLIDDNRSENISVREHIVEVNNEDNNTGVVSSGIKDTGKSKGIFSGLKSVFGFGSKKESSTNIAKKEENIDLQILATAIDALYIGSSYFEDNTIINIFKALYDSCTVLTEKNPVINDSITTYLHFNITKMLEISVINVKRIHVFWDLIVKIVNFICIKNIANISRFSLDCLTIIILYIITQYETTNDDWNSENWQKTIFQPFKLIASTDISQHINLNIIYNLSKILQNCGQFLNFNGWNSYIETCQILISKSDEVQCDNTFKLLEQIINEYNDYLSCLNCTSLINLLEGFALYKKNHNLSYSAITMFWNIAAIIEKFQRMAALTDRENNPVYKNFTESQKDFFRANPEELTYFFNNTWKDMFNRLNSINADNRFDVRKAAINIFADVYVAKNLYINNEVSIIILNQYFLQILEKTYNIFEDKLKQNRGKKNVTLDPSNQLKTPKFNDNVGEIKVGDFKIDQLKLPEKKIKFDDETVNKVIQPTADEKEWEDTTILIVQAIGKVLKSFLTVNKDNKDMDYLGTNIIDSIKKSYCKLMRLTTPEVAGNLLRSVQEIYYANSELFLHFFDKLWDIYSELGYFITTEFFMINLCTMATSTKMVSNTLEILRDIFLKESNIEIKPDLMKGKNLENLLSFIKTLVRSARNCEGIQVITNPQRILCDEKLIFDFTEKVSKNLDSLESWVIYSNYLSYFIKFDLNDPHSEAHCRKALEVFETFFNTKQLSTAYLKKYIPKLIYDIKEIACLRNKNDYVVVLIKNNKSQFHLWQFAIFQLIKILNVILCGGKKNKEDGGVNTTTTTSTTTSDYSSNNYMSNYSQSTTDNTDSLNEIWEAVISCFETIFRQSESGYKTISRNILEELLKSCQEMEIQIINFIVNGLLPNSLKIPKEMQIKLLMLLDIGSNFDYNLFNLGSQTSSSSSSISRVCISNLFELCKYRSEDSLKKGKVYVLTK